MEKIIFNGKIYLERDSFAEALLIRDGIIERLGTSEELLKLATDATQLLDAGGRTILPGMNDSHLHLRSIGEWLVLPKLSEARSLDGLVEIGRDYLAKNPEFCREGLHGSGWNQDFFTGENRMPTRYDLDRISTEVPIVFSRVCGHVATANSRALELAGVLDTLPQIQGGVIELDAGGQPTGILSEGPAIDYVSRVIPDFSLEEKEELFLRAADYALSVGLTSVQSTDAWDSNYGEMIGLTKKLYREHRLPLRYRHQLSLMDLENLKDYLEGDFFEEDIDRDFLDLGPLKLFKDGSLGGRTALLRQDYRDDEGNLGVEVLSNERMDELVALADSRGLQVITHVIGDGAIERVLDSYSKVLVEGNPHRHGLVHCQITDQALLERIKELGVLVLVQPIFLDYDLHIVVSRVGEELASSSYAFNTMYKLGIINSYGTDAPIEDCNPFPCIYAAVTRKDLKGYPPQGHYPQEGVPLYQAIDNYTLASAYNEFKEDRKGRIKPGYLADMIILDRDIFSIPQEQIKDVLVDMTLLGGRVVYRR